FQLRDDLDGVFGDEAALGKSTSSDIREGKRTMLLALAQERAGETERSVLAATVGNSDADTESIERVREIMTATGARESVENLIRQREDDAREVIANELSSLTSSESCELLDLLVRKLARTDR
ncbi:MAG: polyprenyl synthetase family protein, partial [Dermabacter sp.]|nr:polyprenyl synthetase family protein [Dermabacter sp.]